MVSRGLRLRIEPTSLRARLRKRVYVTPRSPPRRGAAGCSPSQSRASRLRRRSRPSRSGRRFKLFTVPNEHVQPPRDRHVGQVAVLGKLDHRSLPLRQPSQRPVDPERIDLRRVDSSSGACPIDTHRPPAARTLRAVRLVTVSSRAARFGDVHGRPTRQPRRRRGSELSPTRGRLSASATKSTSLHEAATGPPRRRASTHSGAAGSPGRGRSGRGRPPADGRSPCHAPPAGRFRRRSSSPESSQPRRRVGDAPSSRAEGRVGHTAVYIRHSTLSRLPTRRSVPRASVGVRVRAGGLGRRRRRGRGW
jgi:hypothetical protein